MRHKNRVLRIVVLVLIFTAPLLHAAGGITVRAFINKNTITVGDRITYTLEAVASDKIQIQMPEFKGGAIGDLEIKDYSAKTIRHPFGKRTIRSRYIVTAYSVGKKEIPQIEIKYKPNGAKDWAVEKTRAIGITVKSVLPKEMPADIKDVKGPAHFFEMSWFLIGGIALFFIVAVLAYLSYRAIMRRKPVRLPHETALEELEAIRAQLLKDGDIKGYFVGVSDCVRRYIERVFKLRAPEMTSEEFLNSLKDSPTLSISQKDLLKGFMNACDMVKFAKYLPTSRETESVYVTAGSFVEETKEIK